MTRNISSKQVRLGDYPFLEMLTKSPWCWMHETFDKVITITAVEGGVKDWSAYMETPQSGKMVAEFGDKIPKELAEELFPDWAEKYTWRY